MAHYTIELPGNISVDVRKGKIFKKRTGFFNKWPWIKISSEVKIGYIASVDNVPGKIKTEYRLLKTKEGKWLVGGEDDLNPAMRVEGKWQQHTDNFITLAVKKAIDDYENKQ